MGGRGSGGHNRTSDQDKKKNGTFKPYRSEAAYQAKAEKNVIDGPWRLSAIPEPDLPLNEVGKQKYRKVAQQLLEQNKLTFVTREYAEQLALLHQEQHRRLEAGQQIPAYLVSKAQSVLAALRIAENAPKIASPGEKVSKFKGCGFASRIPAAR